MPLRAALPALLAALAATSPARAAECVAAKVGPNVSAQPEPWRKAVLDLVDSTKAGDAPWSCVGGEVDLVVVGPGARLTVTDAEGHTITRDVAVPEDVEPLGEALLAQPMLPPPPPPPPPSQPPSTQEPAQPPPTSDPRVLLAALVMPRFAGRTNAIWGGLQAQAIIPFGAWGAGFWLRGDALSAPLAGPRAPVRDVVVGAAASRSFGVGPVELRVDLRPSLVFLLREVPRADTETRITGRIGAGFATVIPFSRRLRAVIGVDAEIAPFELGRREQHDEHEPRSFWPAYTVGLGAGMEVAIR